MGSVKRVGFRPSPVLWGLALLWSMLALSSPQLATAAGVSLLPESDYTTRSACSAPTPGHASCMALELERRTGATQAQGDPLPDGSGPTTHFETATECTELPSGCLSPRNLQSAYFPGEAPQAPASSPQTVALVDAYNDPKAEADLAVYSKAFDLPAIHACSGSESGCFEQIGQSGTGALPFPQSEEVREAKESVCTTERPEETMLELEEREEACDELVEAEGWAVEISTDIEVTHAVCQNCKILLVEASEPSYGDLEEAEQTAVRLGATEISNSWGGPQEGSNLQAFNHPGIAIVAAGGDDGYLNWTDAEAAAANKEKYYAGADFPASSPDVVAVGGTKLTMVDGVRQSETAWNEDPGPEDENHGAGGGGCSTSFTAPPWQQAVPDWSKVGCKEMRAVADISADGDPYTGVAVYDSVPTIQEPATGEFVNEPLEWWPIGGTSVASPIVGSMFALAGGAHGVAYPAQTLYSHLGTSVLHDVTVGSNGDCHGNYSDCSGSLTSTLDCGVGAWICNATTGYDGPTGVGTPNGIDAFKTIGETEPASQLLSPTNSSDSQPAGGSSSTGSTSGGETQGVAPGAETPSHTAAKQAPRISALALTANAQAALRRRPPAVSQLAFSCVLSQTATVHVTLSLQVHSAGHTRWRALPGSLTFDAVRGLNRRRLRDTAHLSSGTYRLTLAPVGGATSSISIHVA